MFLEDYIKTTVREPLGNVPWRLPVCWEVVETTKLGCISQDLNPGPPACMVKDWSMVHHVLIKFTGLSILKNQSFYFHEYTKASSQGFTKKTNCTWPLMLLPKMQQMLMWRAAVADWAWCLVWTTGTTPRTTEQLVRKVHISKQLNKIQSCNKDDCALNRWRRMIWHLLVWLHC